MDFSVEDLENLAKLISPNEEPSSAYANFSSGSTLNPGSFGQSKTETAPPHAQIKTIINRAPKQEIWQEEDITVQPKVKADDRPEPEYDILYKQRVGPEDVYLGLSGLNPSSAHCQDLLVKIKLPGTRRQDVTIEVEQNSLRLQAPNYKLSLFLPHPVHDKQGSAQWDAQLETLSVALPIDRGELSFN